ncbi:MAG: DNA primase [Planctomycetota bacterium]
MNDGSDDIRRVREATDIVRVVGDVVQLKPKGREFVCLCPFHDDRNPSMYVIPGKQIFHCFVCGAGGDALTFAQRYHGLSFPDALKMLADEAGIELTPRRKGESKPQDDQSDEIDRSTLKAVNEAAMGFFRRILTHPEHGKPGRAVVEHRGISPEMVERFAIGASADRWDGLLLYAKQRGIPESHLFAAGLAKQRENGSGSYDALRNRLIFPILGEAGEPIAFGARRIDDEDEPKYLNSPETALFHKSKTLFGLHQARDAIRREGWVAVVEGYTDVIACHQHGIENVVGTLGTALTAEHAKRLRWKCDRAVLLFDGDDAGQRAADRAFEVLFAGELDVSVVVLSDHTDAKDPDELLAREGGRDLLLDALRNGRDLTEVHFERLRAKAVGKGIAGARRLAEDEIRRLLDAGMDRMEPRARSALLGKMAEVTGVRYEILAAAAGAVRRPNTPEEPATGPQPEPMSGPMRVWLELVACVLTGVEAGPVLLEAHGENLAPELTGDDALITTLALEAARNQETDFAELISKLDADSARGRAILFVRRIEEMLGVPADDARRGQAVADHARDCLDRLRSWSDLESGRSEGPGSPEIGISERLEKMKQAHARHGSNPGARFWTS